MILLEDGRALSVKPLKRAPRRRQYRGYGAAITARVVSDGLAAGASWSWLQSSRAGYRVCQGLGFKTVEFRQVWLSAA
jgi:hypothetical protein